MAKKSKMDAARDTLTGVAEEVKERYEDVAGDVRKRTRDVRKRTRKAGKELRHGAEMARERYQQAGDRLRDGYDRTQDRAREWNRDLNDFVQENPGRALLIAAGAGFLVGLLFRRRG